MSVVRLPAVVPLLTAISGSTAETRFRSSSFSEASNAAMLMYRDCSVLPVILLMSAASDSMPTLRITIAIIVSISVKPPCLLLLNGYVSIGGYRDGVGLVLVREL